MEQDFWHTRWREDRLGFHQQKINSRLTKFWNQTKVEKGQTVFVPLCGKSLDMLWLAENDYKVLGVEISEIACRDFYRENNLDYEIKANPQDETNDENDARFIQFIGSDIDLWCGDFFALNAADLGDPRMPKIVYDRASLIALPEAMRVDYVAHLATLLPLGSQIFLIGMDYDQNKMKGPPFSVPEEVIRELFEAKFSVNILTQSSGPDIVGNLAERGLDTLNEKVYLIERC